MALRSSTFGDLGLVEGTLELSLGDDLGEVEEGAGDGRARDVVDDGDVLVGERRRTVDLDAGVLAPGAPRHRDVDLRPAPVAELEERGRGAVGEDRAGAAGEHRGHPEALALEEMPRD